MKKNTLLVLSLLTTSIAFAEKHEHREHGSHEHGHAQLNVVVENQTVQITMESPANNFFGFEHKPKNTEQHEIVDSAVKDLKRFGSLLQISEKAKCIISDVDVHQPFETKEEHAEHKDEHKHDDDHNKHEESAHSDVDIDVSLTCKNPSKLREMDLTPLFKRFPNFEEIDVQAIINGQQTALEINKQKPTISLK